MPIAAPPRSSHREGRRPPRSPGTGTPAAALRPHLHAEGRIRWDRVGRIALLVLLAIVLLLYIPPLEHWWTQSRTAEQQRRELRALEHEHARLSARARDLRRDSALEREARRLGMVRRGERAFVLEGAPQGPGGALGRVGAP